MIRPIDEKPVHPVDGDRYQPKTEPLVRFRLGSWVLVVTEEDE